MAGPSGNHLFDVLSMFGYWRLYINAVTSAAPENGIWQVESRILNLQLFSASRFTTNKYE